MPELISSKGSLPTVMSAAANKGELVALMMAVFAKKEDKCVLPLSSAVL